MRITVNRVTSDDTTTISIIFIDGKFECFGLEDEYRADKVPGETRIPAGIYKMGLRTVGGFHKRYSTKFPAIHQGMLEVLNVKNFKYVLIHIGNDEGDTEACLLVGSLANTTLGNMNIGHSMLAYKKLYLKVIKAALCGDLDIEYIDNDLVSP